MEQYYNVKRLALVLAVQAEIEAMKAENIVREQNNQSPAYIEQFYDKAQELRDLAYANDEQL
jgi:hypothetical protein